MSTKPKDTASQDYWDGLITENEAARFVGLTCRALRNWRHRGGGPRFCRISSRAIRYRRRDLQDWADARSHSNTSQYAS